MESFELAQWAIIAILAWRVLLLENSQLKKSDLQSIHDGMEYILQSIKSQR